MRVAALARGLGLATLIGIAGCAYQGGGVANPLTRRATWFSFVAGNDIRAACTPGAPDHFRMIYNGLWTEQVRIYELGAAGPRRLDERIIGQPTVDDFSLTDPLAPWRGDGGSVTLTDNQYDALLHQLDISDAYHSPTSTLTLRADAFYWVAATCHEGVFHLTAWLYPSAAFDHASFTAWLAGIDNTGIPFNKPRPWTEVATMAGGTGSAYATTTAPRNLPPATSWSFGIAQDRMVDALEF